MYCSINNKKLWHRLNISLKYFLSLQKKKKPSHRKSWTAASEPSTQRLALCCKILPSTYKYDVTHYMCHWKTPFLYKCGVAHCLSMNISIKNKHSKDEGSKEPKKSTKSEEEDTFWLAYSDLQWNAGGILRSGSQVTTWLITFMFRARINTQTHVYIYCPSAVVFTRISPAAESTKSCEAV